ncbi:MAG: glycosyltransferase family 2 protein [Bacteroidota bacterium]
MYPKISVIVPNYNHDTFLERCILSVIDQDYPNKELIVIDGGSTDNSVEIIKRHSQHITFWVSERDKGTFEANNKGLRKMSGDYWSVLNADDVLLPGALRTVAEAIEQNPGVKWLTGGSLRYDSNDQVIGEMSPVEPVPVAGYTFLASCWIDHPSTFLHRSVVEDVGPFDAYHLMDYDYWLRMEAAGYSPYLIQKMLSAQRVHEGSKSFNAVKLHEEFFKLMTSFCEKHGIETKDARDRLKGQEGHVTRLRAALLLKANKRFDVLRVLFQFIMRYPATILQRWPWGFVKRVVLGTRKNDPANDERLTGEGTGNWNTLSNS